MTTIEATTAAPPTCEARAGFFASAYGFQPAWCDVRIGLRSYIDRGGATRWFCSSKGHRQVVEGRYPPEKYRSEIADDGLGQAKARDEIVIEDHDAYVVVADRAD